MSRLDGLDELAIPGVDVQPGVRTTVFVGVGKDDRPFQPKRIEIGPDIAPKFYVLAFRSGGAEQFAAPGQHVPAEIFLPFAASDLLCQICLPGGALELDIINHTRDVQRFACVFAGRWIPRDVVSDAQVRKMIARARGRR